MTALDEHIDHRSIAAAVVLAAAAVATGIGYGTYSASGADASGYVSQAELIASGRLYRDEPLARLLPWPQTAWVFSPLGYRPGPAPGEGVPTYPPGLPLTMAAARTVGGEWAPYFVVPLLGGLTVFCAYVLGANLCSRKAGLIAAALMSTSPIFLFQLVQPMSDIPALAWWTVALLLAFSSERGALLAAGAVSGFAVLARPNLVPLVVPLTMIVCGRPTALGELHGKPAHRLLAFAAGLIPGIGALGLVQWRLYGGPLASGHGAFGDFFSFSNIWPNTLGYSVRVLRGETAVCLAVASLAALALARHSLQRKAEREILAAAAATTLVAVVVLVWYLHMSCSPTGLTCGFLLPAFPLAFVVAGALAVRATSVLPRPCQGFSS